MHTLRLLTLPALLTAANLPAQWVAATPPTTVGNRAGHCMAGDLAGNALLFGGAATFSPLAQTWTYDGATWTQLAPTTTPTGRTMADMVYDISRNVYVLYGGWTTAISVGTGSNQTWEWNGTNWNQASPASNPGGLWKHSMAYDSARSRVVLYGGSTNGFPIANAATWEYDGTNWTQVPGATQPGPRERAAMCYDVGNAVTVLFSGIDPQVGGNTTTWLFNGTTWSAAPVVGATPAARTGARMVYDLVRGVCVLVGGMNPTNGAAFNDTWEWNGVTWNQVPTAATPGRDFGLAFDAARRLVVRHGGIVGSTVNGVTDEYGARVKSFGIGCVGSVGAPLLAASDAPRIGQPWPLVLSNCNPTQPVAVFALGLSALGALPLDFLGMTGCIGYATPDLIIYAPAVAGAAGWSLPLPANIGLMGIPLFAQGVSVDPGFNPAGAVSSNAIEALVGN